MIWIWISHTFLMYLDTINRHVKYPQFLMENISNLAGQSSQRGTNKASVFCQNKDRLWQTQLDEGWAMEWNVPVKATKRVWEQCPHELLLHLKQQLHNSWQFPLHWKDTHKRVCTWNTHTIRLHPVLGRGTLHSSTYVAVTHLPLQSTAVKCITLDMQLHWAHQSAHIFLRHYGMHR